MITANVSWMGTAFIPWEFKFTRNNANRIIHNLGILINCTKFTSIAEMSSQAIKTLGVFKKLTNFDKGLGARLPEAYKKFYAEWKLTQSAAVHYFPEEGRWKRDEVTGEVHLIQNHPIPLKFPPEHDEQMWGGEGVVQGFQKRSKFRRRVPHFWVPVLQRSVIYSEVLNKHISVIVTSRALQLINENYGLDHYLLKTLACDLKSLLPLGLKRKILLELQEGCPAYADKPDKQREICNRYKQYLEAYTPEEIEWYGYSFDDACKKLQDQIAAAKTVVPLKHIFRAQLLEKLATEDSSVESSENLTGPASWIQKINPFTKKHET